MRQIIAAQPGLYRYALRRTGNHHDAEDLVQETLLCAHRGYATFQQGTNLNAWLFRIMANACISRHRKSLRRPVEFSYDAFDDNDSRDNVVHAHVAGTQTAEDHALDCLPDGPLAVAMKLLPDDVRLIVYYAHVHGYRYQDIARLTDTPLGTVMSRLSRARSKLRICLEVDPREGLRG